MPVEVSKKNTTFSLSGDSLKVLQEIKELVGESKTKVIEEALAIYKKFLLSKGTEKDKVILDKLKDVMRDNDKVMYNALKEVLKTVQ